MDLQWNEVGGDQRLATYTALPARSYEFRLQGATGRGAWSEPGVVLHIAVLPAWWQTWWFRSGVGSTLLAMAFVAYRARVKNIAAREREFRKLAENAPDMVMRLDSGARYLYVNPAVERHADLPKTAILGRTNDELGSLGARIPVLITALRQAFDTGRPIAREFTLSTPKGELHFESRLVPESSAGGSPKSVLVITRDITERKRAERELQRSEATLARAQRLSSTGSFSWRPSGEIVLSEESRRIGELAPEARVTLEQLRGLTHPEDLPMLQRTLSGKGSDCSLEFRLILPDGRTKYLQVMATALHDGSGQLVEWTGAVRDVTELKKSEDALHKTRAELAHVARMGALGALSASIAHEVNQPLAGVIMNGNACLRWLGATPNLQEAREAAQRVVRDGARAGGVIARLRALFTKVGPSNEPVNLNEAIEDVLALTRREVRDAQVLLRTDLAADLPTTPGDRVQLRQVVLNLILNALDAMRGIHDRPRELLISTRSESSRIEVAVTDSGVGLEPQTLKKVFEAFYTTKGDGMGMGLSISQSIVESHGGKIWAEPNVMAGATFRFTLPRGP